MCQYNFVSYDDFLRKKVLSKMEIIEFYFENVLLVDNTVFYPLNFK